MAWLQLVGAGWNGFTGLQESRGPLHHLWISVTCQVKTHSHWSVADCRFCFSIGWS